jgi:hypothetical protein
LRRRLMIWILKRTQRSGYCTSSAHSTGPYMASLLGTCSRGATYLVKFDTWTHRHGKEWRRSPKMSNHAFDTCQCYRTSVTAHVSTDACRDKPNSSCLMHLRQNSVVWFAKAEIVSTAQLHKEQGWTRLVRWTETFIVS